jgi:hypothetical protein
MHINFSSKNISISAGGFFEVHSASLKKYTGGAAFGVADASLVSTALR